MRQKKFQEMKQLVLLKIHLMLNLWVNTEYQDIKQLVLLKIQLVINGWVNTKNNKTKQLGLLKIQLIIHKNVQEDKSLKLKNNSASEHIEPNNNKIVLQILIRLQVPYIMHRLPST